MTNPRPIFRIISEHICISAGGNSLLLLVQAPAARGQVMALAAVPDTPLELVTGSARALITPEARDEAMDLLAARAAERDVARGGRTSFPNESVVHIERRIRNSKATARWRNFTRARCCAGRSGSRVPRRCTSYRAGKRSRRTPRAGTAARADGSRGDLSSRSDPRRVPE